jgi:hypothetical protein
VTKPRGRALRWRQGHPDARIRSPVGAVIGLMPEQHGPQREEYRGDPDDHGGLPFKDGGRLFHNGITAKGS